MTDPASRLFPWILAFAIMTLVWVFNRRSNMHPIPNFKGYWQSGCSDIKGARPQDQLPGRTGCRGIVYLRREKDLDWQRSLMNVQPYKNVIAADKIPSR
jgi:hypothetical protein